MRRPLRILALGLVGVVVAALTWLARRKGKA